MRTRRTLEGLSLCFTAGVAGGTWGLPGDMGRPMAAGITLVLLALALPWIRRHPGRAAFGLLFFATGCWVAWTGTFTGIAPPSPTRLQTWCTAAGAGLRRRIDALPFRNPHTAALLKAFLSGDRSDLSPSVRTLFRQSGASHLLALSGLHAGVLYVMVEKGTALAGKAPLIARLRSIVIMAGGILFTAITGASPSLVRACLFVLLREGARLAHRRTDLGQLLCTALLLQLALWPGTIRSLGFQLSYLAVGGIAVLYPRLEAFYPPSYRGDPLRRIWQSAALTLSCQAFTAPLVWWKFGTIPAGFLLTNLMAIPLTTLCLGAGIGALAAGGWFVPLADACCEALVAALGILADL